MFFSTHTGSCHERDDQSPKAEKRERETAAVTGVASERQGHHESRAKPTCAWCSDAAPDAAGWRDGGGEGAALATASYWVLR